MAICTRCGKNRRYWFRWETKMEKVTICRSCCMNLIHWLVQLKRLTPIDLVNYAVGKADKLKRG